MQAKTPKYIRYLCVESEQELHKWVTAIRIAKNGRHLYTNYRSVVEEIAHADIDILTSKRFSGAESGGNQNIVSHHPTSNPTGNTASKLGEIQASSNPRVPQTLQVEGGRDNRTALTNSNNYLSSPARTPSSENKSFDSALSSGIVSDISSIANPSASSEYSEFSASEMDSSIDNSMTSSNRMIGADDTTPVNTIQRHQSHSTTLDNSLRRSMSRTSKSSSPDTASTSSGCLSDRGSSSGGSGSQPFMPNGVVSHDATKSKSPRQQNNAGGFDTDYHVGGTIKKRPPVLTSTSKIANPRIPLTNTTWGLVARDSDEDEISSLGNSADSISDSSSGRGGNIRIGGGGTLLRCSTGIRKNSQNNNVSQSIISSNVTNVNTLNRDGIELHTRSSENNQFIVSNNEMRSIYSDRNSVNSSNPASIVQVQVHNNPNEHRIHNTHMQENIDIISEEFEQRLNNGYGENQPLNPIASKPSDIPTGGVDDDIPLPPPPRPESTQVLSSLTYDARQSVQTSSRDEVDDLPPPPPPEIYEQLNFQNQLNGCLNNGLLQQGIVQSCEQPKHESYQPSHNAMKTQLPHTLPPSSLKSPQVNII